MTFKKTVIILTLMFASLLMSGCGIVDIIRENTFSFVGLTETGTVISKSVYIRSSFAVVAADLLEVKRGETIEILSEEEFANTLWYRVRAFDEVSTEGWIEAQHVIKGESLEKSKALAEAVKDLQSQAVGRLRAPSNLRLSPSQEDSNILLRLDNSGDNRVAFEIVDWEYKPKEQEPKVPENAEIEAAKEGNETEKLDEKYDIWYKVRLDPSVSPAPMGWIFGRQVDLEVPTDIIYYQTNARKFVTWLSLDNNSVSGNTIDNDDTDVKVTKPGSWLILSRTNEVKAKDGIEPDFDGVLVLGFDTYNEEHYTAYNTARESIDIWGTLPVKLEGAGDDKTFTVNLRNSKTGEMESKQFVIYKDKNKRLRVRAPEGL